MTPSTSSVSICKHRDDMEEITIVEEMPTYQFGCDRCGKGFTHENNLLRHKEEHIFPTNSMGKPKPSAPNQPTERSLNNDKVYKHKKFQFQFNFSDINNCDKCGKVFNNNDQLEEHMIEHRAVQEKTNVTQQYNVVCGCRFPCVPIRGFTKAPAGVEAQEKKEGTGGLQETRRQAGQEETRQWETRQGRLEDWRR